MGRWFLCSDMIDTYHGGDNFNQTEDEEDIAHCVKAPPTAMKMVNIFWRVFI